MPEQTDTAIPTRLSSLDIQSVNSKVRVVGRVIHTFATRSLIVISEGPYILPVEVSLCTNPFRTAPWLREKNSLVSVIGYVESVKDELVVARAITEFGLDVSLTIFLKAILVAETNELNVPTWNRAIEMRQALLARRALEDTS